MSAVAITNRPQSSKAWLFVLVIVTALVVWAVLDLSNVHAVTKHGDEAWMVRNCSTSQGFWVNPITGREARICQLDDERFGIQIIEDGREVTSFIKEKMKDIGQVFRYLRNRGYEPVYGESPW